MPPASFRYAVSGLAIIETLPRVGNKMVALTKTSRFNVGPYFQRYKYVCIIFIPSVETSA